MNKCVLLIGSSEVCIYNFRKELAERLLGEALSGGNCFALRQQI